jgi:hypothetical protein
MVAAHEESSSSEINSSSVDAILDQNDTHYILHMTNNSVKSMNKSIFGSSFIRAQNGQWTKKNAVIIDQILNLQR